MEAEDAERVQRPKLPKKRLLRKSRKRRPNPPQTDNDAETSKLERRTKRGLAFCPKCGSTDVSFASGLPQLRSSWDCRNCGYRGELILEDGKMASKLAEEYAKRIAQR